MSQQEGKRTTRGNGPNCGHCGKPNHVETQRWRKPGNEYLKHDWLKKKEQVNASVDEGTSPELLVCCMEVGTELSELQFCGLTFPTAQKILSDPNVWIADSVATVCSTGHKEGLYELRCSGAGDNIIMGNGAKESAHAIGKRTGTICDQYGNQVNKYTMQDVTLLPTGMFNLFSLAVMQRRGWLLYGDVKKIWREKDGNKIVFDLMVPTPKGVVYCMYLNRQSEIVNPNTDTDEAAAPIAAATATMMNISQAHAKFGHSNEGDTRKMAKEMGITITRGTLGPCDACMIAKAKQKNVPKVSTHKATTKTDERRIFLDISSVKANKQGKKPTKPHWRIMVDKRSTLKLSNFFETKNGMVEPTCEQLHRCTMMAPPSQLPSPMRWSSGSC
jgi:hypothetical protein